MKKFIKSLINSIAYIFSFLIICKINKAISYFFKKVFWYSLKRQFCKVGRNSFIEYPVMTKGLKYITIGDNFTSYARLRLEAYDKHLNNFYNPQIIIGNNVSLNYDCHIGCVNKIVIGDNTSIGDRTEIHAGKLVDIGSGPLPHALSLTCLCSCTLRPNSIEAFFLRMRTPLPTLKSDPHFANAGL
jgi:acetyltransferase-like isoleucine patch superfamily enzyme